MPQVTSIDMAFNFFLAGPRKSCAKANHFFVLVCNSKKKLLICIKRTLPIFESHYSHLDIQHFPDGTVDISRFTRRCSFCLSGHSCYRPKSNLTQTQILKDIHLPLYHFIHTTWTRQCAYIYTNSNSQIHSMAFIQ